MVTKTTDALLAELRTLRTEMQRDYAALPNMLDLPPMTERQKNTEAERRYRFPQFLVLCGTLTEQLEKAVATRATATPPRDRLRAVNTTIEQLIADAPDYREIADSRASSAEWARQNALAASLTAIKRGVEYFNGGPALPGPLRELLTDVCPHCGHAALMWPGPLSTLEEAVEEADRQIALVPGNIASLRADIAMYLAPARIDETVST